MGVQETFVKLGGRRVLPYFRFQRLLIGTARYDHTAICVQTGVSHTQPSECGSKRACISDTCVQSGVSDTVVMAAAGRAVRVHVPGERTAAHRQLVWRLLCDAPLLCERYGHTPPCKALRCVCRAYLTGSVGGLTYASLSLQLGRGRRVTADTSRPVSERARRTTPFLLSLPAGPVRYLSYTYRVVYRISQGGRAACVQAAAVFRRASADDVHGEATSAPPA